MGWIALAVLVTAVTSFGFMILQAKAGWAEWRVAREWQDAHPRPPRRRDSLRDAVLGAFLYAMIGLAFLLGWLADGLTGGGAAAAAMLGLVTVVGAFFAIKTSIVSRMRSPEERGTRP